MRARGILDDADLTRVRVVVSGGLDEFAIAAMQAAGAPVDLFAVGTKVETSADAPYLDAAYKLVDYGGRPVRKLSTRNVTLPGASRCTASPGCTDVLSLRDENAPAGTEPLLETVMCDGARRSSQPTSRIRSGGTPQKPVAPRRPVDGPSAVHRRHRGRRPDGHVRLAPHRLRSTCPGLR